MKFAVATIAYNESEYIQAVVRNWTDIPGVDKHLVLVSTKPWNGEAVEDDGTADLAREAGADVEVDFWESEADQRNHAIARLWDYDYIIIVDADELYTREAQDKLLELMNNPIDRSYRTDKYVPAFRIRRMITYWKNSDYVLDPPDRHKPVIAIDPKQLYCHEHRMFGVDYAPLIDDACHHMSWAKSDAKIKEKIQSFSHADSIREGWYENVWGKWEPGDSTQVRAYGQEPSIATYRPAPQEIMDLIEK